jgi:hypothetical protein
MLAELDVLVFLKSGDDLERVAERVFGALHTPYALASLEDPPDVPYYEGSGLGFQASVYANAGDLLDPEFESYQYALQVSSEFWCVELDTLDLETSLSEYYSRLLAFDLNVETSTEIFIEGTEEAEVFEIRSYRPNPQYRMDQGPTTPRVYVVETRQVERPFDDETWDDDQDQQDLDEEEYDNQDPEDTGIEDSTDVGPAPR